MILQDVHLRTDIFNPDVKQEPIRKGYGEGLLQAGQENEQVVALCADLTESTMTHLFANAFPKRFIEMGIGEQSMASVASGMAAMGKIPFFSSYAMFSPGRNWEQIRTTICYNNVNAKIAGSHAGISVGPDGGTHQAIEDIAITRVMPRMTVLVPMDAVEAKKATLAAAKMVGPVYIRLAREKTPLITTEETPFEIGKARILWEGNNPQVALVACGALVHNALLAARALQDEGVSSIVLANTTIKPLDVKALVSVVEKTGAVVTIEEHQVMGGMGSAVSEALSGSHPVPIEFVGVHDMFGQSGEPTQLIEHYGMGVSSIKAAAQKVISRK